MKEHRLKQHMHACFLCVALAICKYNLHSAHMCAFAAHTYIFTSHQTHQKFQACSFQQPALWLLFSNLQYGYHSSTCSMVTDQDLCSLALLPWYLALSCRTLDPHTHIAPPLQPLSKSYNSSSSSSHRLINICFSSAHNALDCLPAPFARMTGKTHQSDNFHYSARTCRLLPTRVTHHSAPIQSVVTDSCYTIKSNIT
jgi:hypothetical protein